MCRDKKIDKKTPKKRDHCVTAREGLERKTGTKKIMFPWRVVSVVGGGWSGAYPTRLREKVRMVREGN
jgi:hypothetical protein